MIWQDYAVTIIVYMFVFVTIPQLIEVMKGKTSLNLLTAGATALGNYCLGFIFSYYCSNPFIGIAQFRF